jgi:hypothetical protein
LKKALKLSILATGSDAVSARSGYRFRGPIVLGYNPKKQSMNSTSNGKFGSTAEPQQFGRMLSMNKYLVGGILSIAFLFPAAAKAMETVDFDKLTKNQQASYLVFMVDGSADFLKKAGQSADAQKLLDLFTNTVPGQNLPLGNQQFLTNLNAARALNNKNANNPNQLIEMEQIFGITLKTYGIDISIDDLEALSGKFKPSSGSQN